MVREISPTPNGTIGTTDQAHAASNRLPRARLGREHTLESAKSFQMLREEYRSARQELLWRLNGIYDIQKTALPLIIALMAALAWAGAEPGKFPKMSLLAGWMLIPFFFSLARTKIKHHRQRNKELAHYIKNIEARVYGKIQTEGAAQANGEATPEEIVRRVENELGWEHFIRSYRHVLPQIIRESEEVDGAKSRQLAHSYGSSKTIESMSHIELRYMNIFWVFAFSISAFQVLYIMTGIDLWTIISTELGKLVISRWT